MVILQQEHRPRPINMAKKLKKANALMKHFQTFIQTRLQTITEHEKYRTTFPAADFGTECKGQVSQIFGN